MSERTSVTLKEPLATFAEEQVAAGRYASVGDVVNAGLELLERRQSELDAVRAALEEGERSGPAEPLDVEDVLRELHAAHGA